jgi:purine-nucleoside phosphorylase
LAEAARAYLGSEWEGVEVAAVLGSGLGEAANGSPVRARIAYDVVPGLGSCAVPGHAGCLLRASIAGREAVLFQGRRHLYEGITPAEAAFPARLAAALGARLLVLCSAVGGIGPAARVGSWVLVEDHLNLMGRNPLEGVGTPTGPAFVDLTQTYRVDLHDALSERLSGRGVPLSRGILAAFPGPSYETPAEVRMARTLGADVVGMSTVPEAVWARFLGLDVLALGHVVNPAAGLGDGVLCHEDVVRRSASGARQGALVIEEAVRTWAGG